METRSDAGLSPAFAQSTVYGRSDDHLDAETTVADAKGCDPDPLHRMIDITDTFLVESLTEYAIFAISPVGIIMSWNHGAQRTFGYTAAEIVGRSFEIIFTSEDIESGAPRTELNNALDGRRLHYDRWHLRKDGSRFWGINTVHPLIDPHGALKGFTKLVRDRTASYLAFEQLKDSEQKLRLLVESTRGYAIFSLTSNGLVNSWTFGAERLFGYSRAEVLGKPYSILFRPEDVERARADLRDVEISGSVDTEGWLLHRDGSTFFASGKISKLITNVAGDPRGFVVLAHDVTTQHLAVQEVRRQARYDALTDLPNRRTFYEHVQRAIALSKRHSLRLFAIMFIDLDNFKAVNDELGHVLADQVLTSIARRLESCLRTGDIVARIGGDEFAILLNGIDGPLDADNTAQRILAQMQSPVHTDSGDIFAAVSLGIAIANAKHERPEEIIREADAAMYIAKSEGRGRAVAFNGSVGNVVRTYQDHAANLRQAIERDELRLAYQPVFRLHDMAVVGLEALVRWKHPNLGLLLPSAFVPRAEESGLILRLDCWVLTHACKQLRHWQSRGVTAPDVQMSVNVSSKEFSRNEFVGELHEILEVNALSPTSLRLEITEGTALERSYRTSATLAAVRTLGVSVDVDDFGTGYASLSSLNQIVVDGLKVDWSFLSNSVSNHGWDIVDAVVALSKKLGVIAVAEGIETTEQLSRLMKLGCEFGQGHLFSPALGAVAAGAFLRDKRQV